MASKTVYVGNLPADVRKSEVEDLFGKYGRIRDVDLKTPMRPPAFAFVEFDSPNDAEDAVRGRDGYDFDGNRLRVEIAQGGGRRGFGGPPPFAGGFGGGDGRPPPFGGPPFGGGFGGGYGGGGMNRGGVSRRTGYRVMVTGLPKSASWQDLKDHFRRAGDVTFTQVFRDRGEKMMGIVDFATRDDMERAVRKMDDTRFENPFDKAYIRVKEDRDGGRSRSRSRSRARSYSRSRSRGRSYSRSRSRSYSRSRSRSSRSRSVSKSRSRSRSASRSKSRSASKERSKSRSASKERSKSRSASKERSKSRSASPAKSRSASPAENGKSASPAPADD